MHSHAGWLAALGAAILFLVLWHVLPDSWFTWLDYVAVKWLVGTAALMAFLHLIVVVWQIMRLGVICWFIASVSYMGTPVIVIDALGGWRAELSIERRQADDDGGVAVTDEDDSSHRRDPVSDSEQKIVDFLSGSRNVIAAGVYRTKESSELLKIAWLAFLIACGLTFRWSYETERRLT
jgi:hypothetical protein